MYPQDASKTNELIHRDLEKSEPDYDKLLKICEIKLKDSLAQATKMLPSQIRALRG